MRDDDNNQAYAPVLRRIIILVAVITAVPVMLWTITAFMRTYVAQPVLPGARPLAAVTSPSPGSVVADAGTTGTSASAPDASPPPAAPASVAAAATSAPDTDSKGDRLGDGDSNASAGAPKVAALAPAQVAPATAPAAAPLPDATTSSIPAAPVVVVPDAAPNPGPAMAAQPAEQPASSGTETEPLLASEPLTGPIPLPPHRPTVFALAETGVPLPRPRPVVEEAEPAPSGVDLGLLGKLFGQH
jgi:hypothetical protein